MPVSRPTVALLVLLTVLVAACTADESSPDPVPTPPSAAEPGPKVGRCHRLTAAEIEAGAESGPTVSCQVRHTSETFAAVDVAEVPLADRLEMVERRCTKRFPIYTGGEREDSIIDWVALRSSSSAEATWWRCEAFVSAGQFKPIPVSHVGSVAGALRPTIPVALQRCTDRNWRRYVPCGRPHRFEQIARSIVLGDPGDPYLTRGLYEATVRPHCGRAFRRAAPARPRPAGSVENQTRWPSRKGWADGQRSGTCWVAAVHGRLPPRTVEIRH